jgi:hypothetical protein
MRSIKSRTDILSPLQILLVRNTGFPKGRESYGNGASIIVVEVTPHQGERESRSQGEGRQVSKLERNGGARMSKAERTLLAMQKHGRCMPNMPQTHHSNKPRRPSGVTAPEPLIIRNSLRGGS